MRGLLQLKFNVGLWNEVLHHTAVLDHARRRIFAVGCGIVFFYLIVAFRLTDVMVLKTPSAQRIGPVAEIGKNQYARQDILDRNGEILATQIVTASVYADPKNILDPQEAAEKLATVFPEIGFDNLLHRLKQSNKSFIWIARHVTPKVQDMIYRLGVPGVFLQKDHKRVYPHGDLCSHILGGCDIDGSGHSGVELQFDEHLRNMRLNQPVRLSIDVRVQHIVSEVLQQAVEQFEAVGGNAMVMRIPDGQILSMVSLPNYDPNKPMQDSEIFNRNTMGVYEPGSTFKIVNTAVALETGQVNPSTILDARFPVKIGNFTVTDFRGANSFLTLEQAFVKSSNVAAIQLARIVGARTQHEFLKRFGVFDTAQIELPEKNVPLHPENWTEVTSWTASYGYGIALCPLSMISIVASLINDGNSVKPTLLFMSDDYVKACYANLTPVKNLVSAETSSHLRSFMRMVVSGKPYDVPSCKLIGKTGTAYKRIGSKGYGKVKSRRTSFIGAFPEHKPQYILLVMLDEPKATKETHGYATGGWNAAPTAAKIVRRLESMLPIDESLNTSEESANCNPVKLGPQVMQNTSYKAR